MLKCKAWINILLYNMISMLVVRPSFKINVLNIKQAFHSNYHEGDKVFYIFLLNWKGEKELKDAHEVKWIVHWCSENQRFEDILLGNLDFKPHSRWMCFVWDGNHMLQAKIPYIHCVHNDEPSWHIFVDSILLDTSHSFVEFLTPMINLK